MRSGLIVLGAMLLAACSAGPTGESRPPSTTAAAITAVTTMVPAVASTSTAPPSTPTTTLVAVASPDLTHPDAPAPEVDLRAETFDELIRVWDEIDRYLVWLDSHPTTNREVLALVLEPGSEAFVARSELLAQLAQFDYRIIGSSFLGDVTAFSCCPDPQRDVDAGVITVAVQSRSTSPTATAIDSEGQVVAELPGWDLREWRIVFRRAENGEWRIVSFSS
jgi:hypothetical protein